MHLPKNLSSIAGLGAPKTGGLAKLAGIAPAAKQSGILETANAAKELLDHAKTVTEGAERRVIELEVQTEELRTDFIYDRTASREPAIEEAKAAQAVVFKNAEEAGSIAIRLTHFGGGTVATSDYFTNADDAVSYMNRFGCESGSTQYAEALGQALSFPDGKMTNCLILAGDCFEEPDSRDKMLNYADFCKENGIMVFTLFDALAIQRSPEYAAFSAARMFELFAARADGIAVVLGKDISFKDIVSAATVFMTGGEEALKKRPDLLKAGEKILQKLRARAARRALPFMHNALK